MSKNLVGLVGTATVDNLIARITPPAECVGATFASGTGALARGTLVDITDPAAATVAGDTVNGILAEDIDATEAAVTAPVYVTGCFNPAAVTGTLTNANKDELRKYGITFVECV